jgi:hypothetical protein
MRRASALSLALFLLPEFVGAQPPGGVSPSQTKQIVWQDNIAIIGAGAVDPPASQIFQPGTLFWRTDLQRFRYYASGAWHFADETVVTDGSLALAGSTLTAGIVAVNDRIIISPAVKGANQFDATITSFDLTTAREWKFPNSGGTVALTSDIPSTPTLAAVTAAGASTTTAVTLGGATPLVLDGATAGTNATSISVTDPTGANTITIPNASGTVALANSTSSYTSGTTSLTFATSDGTVASILPLKALTAATATPVVLVGVASGASCGGVLEYTVLAADATPDYQTRHGAFNFSVVNKAGTEVCTVGAATQALDGSVLAISSGGADTLTYAITCDNAPTNGVYLSFAAASSLTETSLNIKPRINMDPSAAGVCTVTAQ